MKSDSTNKMTPNREQFFNCMLDLAERAIELQDPDAATIFTTVAATFADGSATQFANICAGYSRLRLMEILEENEKAKKPSTDEKTK
jgi:hypothetical protein